MIFIGFVLLAAAAVFGLDLIWKNHYAMRSPALFGQTLGIHNAAVFFVVAAICGAVLVIGVAVLLAGMRRKGHKAKQHRAERREARRASRDRDKVQQENEQLRRQLGHDDADTAADPEVTPSTATASE
jgi:hypothetical protein